MKRKSKLISIIYLSISILLLGYIFYRSQIYHGESLFTYYIKYYVLCVLFIIFSLISFFINKKTKINITIFFISILISLYALEGFLLLKKNLSSKEKMKEKIALYNKSNVKKYDERSKLQLYTELKKKNTNVFIRIHPPAFSRDENLNIFPLSAGISNRTTIQCNENGYYSIYESDKYGFNNPNVEWEKDIIDFVLLGDSFVNGSCVNEQDTISGNLRKLNNKNNGVINLGQGGSGPLIQYATLREFFIKKNTKIVLWFYFEGNDLWDLRGEYENKILLKYLEDKNFTQNLISKNIELEKLYINKLEQKLLEPTGTKKFDFYRFVKLKNIRTLTLDFFFPGSIPGEELKNILTLSNDLVKKNNSKIYFIYLPQHARYKDNNNADFSNYKKVIEIVKKTNIPIIDMNIELFNKIKDPLSLFPFNQSGHYNEEGYKLVAETIISKIKDF